MAGEGGRLVADAFHEVAVAADDIGEMVDEVGAEAGRHDPLGERHADGGGDALAQRAGGGFDAVRLVDLGMAGGQRAPLAEGPERLDAEARIAGEMEDAVEQHRAVAGGQHEAVAVGPFRGVRVEDQAGAEEGHGGVGHAERQARMAGLGLLDGVHGERADGVGEGQRRGCRGEAAGHGGLQGTVDGEGQGGG